MTPLANDQFSELWENAIHKDFAPDHIAHAMARVRGESLPTPRQLQPDEVVELREFHNQLEGIYPEDF